MYELISFSACYVMHFGNISDTITGTSDHSSSKMNGNSIAIPTENQYQTPIYNKETPPAFEQAMHDTSLMSRRKINKWLLGKA